MSADPRMTALRAARRSWRPVLMGQIRPESHSSLAVDDQVFPSLPPSTIAWTSISLAVHAYDRALDALDRETTSLDLDVLPCLRTSMLHGATALAVLGPARARRIDHGLRMAWTAFNTPEAQSSSLKPLAPFANALVVREAKALLVKRSFTASPRWTDQSSVRVAAEQMRPHVSDPELFEATLRHLWHEKEHPTSVRDDAVLCAESIATLLKRSLSLWDARVNAALTSHGVPEATAAVIDSLGVPQPSVY